MEPLTPADVKPLAERYAELVQELRLGAGEPLLVLPNGDFFPDLFRGDEASLERLVARLSGYAGLETTELTVRLRGAGAGESCSTGGCGTGACGDTSASQDQGPLRLSREEHGFVLDVPGALLSDPIVLTSRLAVAVASLVFLEREAFGSEASLTPELAEATAVALGFAAGAMAWIAGRELVPAALEGASRRSVAVAAVAAFVPMLALQLLLLP